MRRRTQIALAVAATAAMGLSATAAATTPTPDPGAVAVVKSYIAALSKPDPQAAFVLLTPAQQHYFRNARNFASNYSTTQYRISSYSILKTTIRNADLVQFDVSQVTSFFDIAQGSSGTTKAVEPYFALRTAGTWGVKEIYEPWKSYAPAVKGRAGGLQVIVDRVEFFDHRIQVVCTLRNVGTKPVQTLPLLQSTLHVGATTAAAMNAADFPLNDQALFEGARIYPYHQLVGYINFPWTSHDDVDLTATLVIKPIVEDGAEGPASATIGPMKLPKL
jgi:hypothetical protein